MPPLLQGGVWGGSSATTFDHTRPKATDSTREWLARAEERLKQTSWYRQNRARMEAVELLVEQNRRLLDGAVEALENMFAASDSTLEEKAKRKAGIAYCFLMIRYSLLHGDSRLIQEMLVAPSEEIESDFKLSAREIIAIFYLIKDAPSLASLAAAAQPVIEDAIADLDLLPATQDLVKASSEEPVGNGEILTIEEIRNRYPQEWVLIAYRELDENLCIIRGEVLAHSPERQIIYNSLSLRQGKPVAIEYTGLIENI
ncbi:MAG: hypothetical protein F6J93_20450 [Oscillatoria sp. SIO1A7]|nr:hypothetical protein [Oscillatoria sp. SIO1A7]